MIDTKHLLKVGAAWISIVYVICYGGVALIPGIRPAFMLYALHMNVETGQNVVTFGTFVSGLIIWNIIASVALWVFASLYNGIKR